MQNKFEMEWTKNNGRKIKENSFIHQKITSLMTGTGYGTKQNRNNAESHNHNGKNIPHIHMYMEREREMQQGSKYM